MSAEHASATVSEGGKFDYKRRRRGHGTGLVGACTKSKIAFSRSRMIARLRGECGSTFCFCLADEGNLGHRPSSVMSPELESFESFLFALEMS
jgi:hypothetical protein